MKMKIDWEVIRTNVIFALLCVIFVSYFFMAVYVITHFVIKYW